jgi:hypothetical protein
MTTRTVDLAPVPARTFVGWERLLPTYVAGWAHKDVGTDGSRSGGER